MKRHLERPLLGLSAGALCAAVLAACSAGTPPIEGQSPNTESPSQPGQTTSFFFDPHKGGNASSLKLLDMAWGRLVDVYSWEKDPLDPDDDSKRIPTLRHEDYLIGQDIRTDDIDFLLETNAVTEQTTVTILHAKDDPDESADYQAAFAELTLNLGTITQKGLGALELPPFPFVARNAAVSMRFSDLLDPTTITAETIKVFSGYPPSPTQGGAATVDENGNVILPGSGGTPFEARILPDPNHGGLQALPSGSVFRTTRVLVDLAISELEGQQANPPLTPNALGLPPSITTNQPNAAIVIPTVLDQQAGQFALLKSAGGRTLDLVGNGPTHQATKSVVRAMRSGGPAELTGDKNNGFLLDLDPPRLLGNLPVTIKGVPIADPPGTPNYVVNFKFASFECSLTPSPGDVLDLPGGVIAVVDQQAAPPVNQLASDVRVHVLGDDPTAIELLNGALGTFVSSFDPNQDVGRQQCFVTISPTPGNLVDTGVKPMSQIIVQFSEPMDPDSIAPFETMRVTRSATVAGLEDIVVGEVFPSSDLRVFRFVPVLPFSHSTGVPDEYFFGLATDVDGVTDLAGNDVDGLFPAVQFQLKPNDPTESNSGVVLRFASLDEDGDGKNELSGQVLIDPSRGVIKPRPVSRLTGVADRFNNPVLATMIPFAAGVQTPLSPLGSRLMTVWRYCDFQWSSTDLGFYNMDIEHLSWAPIGAQVVPDVYPNFQIELSHSVRLPDEAIDQGSLLPLYEFSGLNASTFDGNRLLDAVATVKVVHPRELGYVIDPLNLFTNANGTRMMPWPLNQSGVLADYVYYTWRDTAIQITGGTFGGGIDLRKMYEVGAPTTGPNTGSVAPGDAAGVGQTAGVPSIGLPLLMDFKCYPAEDTATGLNAFDISLAVNSCARPNFRIFSTGGYNSQDAKIIKNPDQQSNPSGGFTPNGKKTLPADGGDNSFYIGQADVVIRVSRAYTHWFDTQSVAPDYLNPVMEPTIDRQPAGTDVVLAYRGASVVPAAGLLDAAVIDAFGDMPPPQNANGFPLFDRPEKKNNGLTFFPVGDYTWKNDIDDIDGAPLFQVRISFVSNAATGLTPELSGLGVAYRRF